MYPKQFLSGFSSSRFQLLSGILVQQGYQKSSIQPSLAYTRAQGIPPEFSISTRILFCGSSVQLISNRYHFLPLRPYPQQCPETASPLCTNRYINTNFFFRLYISARSFSMSSIFFQSLNFSTSRSSSLGSLSVQPFRFSAKTRHSLSLFLKSSRLLSQFFILFFQWMICLILGFIMLAYSRFSSRYRSRQMMKSKANSFEFFRILWFSYYVRIIFKNKQSGNFLMNVCLFTYFPFISTSQLNQESKADSRSSFCGLRINPMKSVSIFSSEFSVYSTFSPQNSRFMFYCLLILLGLPSSGTFRQYFFVNISPQLNRYIIHIFIQCRSFSSPYYIFSPTESTKLLRISVGSKCLLLLSFSFEKVCLRTSSKSYYFLILFALTLLSIWDSTSGILSDCNISRTNEPMRKQHCMSEFKQQQLETFNKPTGIFYYLISYRVEGLLFPVLVEYIISQSLSLMLWILFKKENDGKRDCFLPLVSFSF